MTTCSEFLVRNGVARGGIVLGPEAPAWYAWLANELQRYLRQLTGAELPLGGPGVQVTLGGPAVSPAAARVEAAGLVHFADLPDEGFVITSALLDGVPHLFLGGNDARATMYAVYEFLERCGIVFHLV